MKDKIIFLILICLLISCENDRKSKTVSPRIKSFTKVSSPSNNEIIKKGDSIFIEIKSKNKINCEEQSLYRNLRKYQHIEVVSFENKKGNKGPDRKYYFLTKMGSELLEKFIERNINLFFSTEINNLLKK